MYEDEKEGTTIYKVVLNHEAPVLDLARRPREPSRVERRGEERHEGGVPGVHQGSVDRHAAA